MSLQNAASAVGKPTGSLLIAERVTAGLLVLSGLLLGLFAESLVSHSAVARSGVFPAHGAIWLGAAVLGLSALSWLIQSLRGRTKASAEGDRRVPLREVTAAFSILLVGGLATYWLGLLAAGVVTYVALMVFYRDRGKIFVAVSAVAYVLVLHYGMEVLLRVPLARSPYLDLPF